MAITTVDGAIAGMRPAVFFSKALTGTMVAGRAHSDWFIGGNPAAATPVTTGLAGTVLSSTSAQVPGQIYFLDAPSGSATYLARFQANATQSMSLMLCDRLWHNVATSVTSTSTQTFTGSQNIPARDANGGTAGDGVLAALEIYSAVGAGTPTGTLVYVGNDGNAGTTTNIVAVTASSITGSFYIFGLQGSHTGIRKCTSLTLSATMTSGTIGVVLFRPIAALELPGGYISNAIDPLTGGFQPIYNGCVPFLVCIPQTTTSSYITGQIIYSQG